MPRRRRNLFAGLKPLPVTLPEDDFPDAKTGAGNNDVCTRCYRNSHWSDGSCTYCDPAPVHFDSQPNNAEDGIPVPMLTSHQSETYVQMARHALASQVRLPTTTVTGRVSSSQPEPQTLPGRLHRYACNQCGNVVLMSRGRFAMNDLRCDPCAELHRARHGQTDYERREQEGLDAIAQRIADDLENELINPTDQCNICDGVGFRTHRGNLGRNVQRPCVCNQGRVPRITVTQYPTQPFRGGAWPTFPTENRTETVIHCRDNSRPCLYPDDCDLYGCAHSAGTHGPRRTVTPPESSEAGSCHREQCVRDDTCIGECPASRRVTP